MDLKQVQYRIIHKASLARNLKARFYILSSDFLLPAGTYMQLPVTSHQIHDFIYVPYFKMNTFKFNPVQNCAGLEFLPYLQAIELVGHSFKDADQRKKALWGSETKDICYFHQ